MKNSFFYLLYIHLLNHLNDLKKYVIVVTILVAIMALVLLGQKMSIDSKEPEGITIGLQMDVQGIYGSMLKSSFFNEDDYAGVVSVEMLQGDEDTSDYDAVVVIPENFFDSLMYFDYAPVQVAIDSDSFVKTYLLREMVQSYNVYIKSVEASVSSIYSVMKEAGYDQEKLFKYNELLAFELIQMALKRAEASSLTFIGFFSDLPQTDYYYSALIVLILWFMSLVVGMKWLDVDHRQLLSRYIVSGRSIVVYLGAYFIVSSALITIVSTVIVLLMSGFGLIQFSGIFYHILVLAIIIAVFTSTTLLVANFFINKSTLTTVVVVLILITSIAGGAVIPIYEMSAKMLDVAKLTPNYWMTRMLISSVRGDLTSEVVTATVVGLSIVIVSIIGSTKVVLLNWRGGRL